MSNYTKYLVIILAKVYTRDIYFFLSPWDYTLVKEALRDLSNCKMSGTANGYVGNIIQFDIG